MAADPLDELGRWAAEARVDEAARSRSRERWLRHQAGEEGSFASLLVDLAERSTPVGLRTTAGRRHLGPVAAVGLDFCAIRGANGLTVLVPLDAVASVRTDAGPALASDRTGGRVDLRLIEALASLAGERARVQLMSAGDPEPVSGELETVGQDVVSVRLDGVAGSVHVRLATLAEVTVVEP